MRTPSFGSSSKDTAECSPVYLNDLSRNTAGEEMVELTLELDDNSLSLCSVAPASISDDDRTTSKSSMSRLRRIFSWRSSTSDAEEQQQVSAAREMMMMRAKMMRNKSSAHTALGGLRFISRSTARESDADVLWKMVESKFQDLAVDGLLSRQDFGECIGMADSKDFAVGVFDALARRRRLKTGRITKEELRDFWLQISDDSFDARLQIFFDMADINGDGRITRDEVQELIILSASANKLSNFKERAKEYGVHS